MRWPSAWKKRELSPNRLRISTSKVKEQPPFTRRHLYNYKQSPTARKNVPDGFIPPSGTRIRTFPSWDVLSFRRCLVRQQTARGAEQSIRQCSQTNRSLAVSISLFLVEGCSV